MTTIITPLGKDPECAIIGARYFKADTLYLIVPPDHEKDVKAIKEKLDINISQLAINGDLWEETFKRVSQIVAGHGNEDFMVNVSATSANSGCAATCAAFVNGIKAFRIVKGKPKFLPVIKFSYYRLIPEKKLDILKYLYENKDCCASMEELSKKLKISLPLLSYHVNGTLRSEGLKKMGLVETNEIKGKTQLELTTLAKLILEGHIVPNSE